MQHSVSRQSVDLSGFPDLVVIYLGMRAQSFRGLRTLLAFGPRIAKSAAAKPDGLLLHENLLFSLKPLHLGMRQYWRDFDALERWARALPHQGWWQAFVRDTGGTGFWHELHFKRGGMEAIYVDVDAPVGAMRFAPLTEARGSMFSARARLRLDGAATESVVSEEELYGSVAGRTLPSADRPANPVT
jgi:hypothetical protein